MKISLNWLKQFTDIDIPVDELVAKIGAQLGAVEEVVDVGKKYQDIVIAQVISCVKHADADKLSVCMIDDGGVVKNVERDEKGHVQVVCGAPNVREGMRVAWLPPGSTVPSTYDKDPFVLGSRELRGVVSNGMLASAHELAIGDDHNGIVEIDIDVAPGSDFAETYELNDYVIDIENKMFTHRPDCFGILGVAREIAGIQGKSFKSPDWYASPLDRIKPGNSKVGLKVSNPIQQLVPRFMAVAMADMQVKNSPLIIQTYLSRVGLRPINNIVDVTNYLMILTGQPIHAYDADKLNNYSLETRMSKKGDTLRLLNGKEITFDDDSSILITSGDKPVGIGGVMGGADTEVGPETKNIVIECANFDMYSVRRTSMKYGLFTDAVTRFNKGQSPLQNDVVLEESVATMEYVGGGHVASEVFDIRSDVSNTITSDIKISAEFVNSRLGLTLATEDMARLLENVEFVVEAHGDNLILTPPYWRTDVEIREDIVEEIGRLYGFDKLPVILPMRSISPAPRNRLLAFKQNIREVLSSYGANEVLTYSFVHGALMQKTGQNPQQAFKLSNALSPDLQFYRMSLTPSLLDKVHPNIKADIAIAGDTNNFALFEIGKVHIKGLHDEQEPDVPAEEQRVALVWSADEKTATQYLHGAAYFQAANYVQQLLAKLNINYSIKPFDHEPSREEGKQLIAAYDLERTGFIESDGIWIGVVGELKADVRKSLKLPVATAAFELDIANLLEVSGKQAYRALPRFPKTVQDITFKVPAKVTHADLLLAVQGGLDKLTNDSMMAMLEARDIYQKKKDEHIHVTFRLWLAHYDRTLTTKEVNGLLDSLASVVQEKLDAERL